LTSKPISSDAGLELMQLMYALEKPVVVNFLGYAPPAHRIGNVFFASTLRQTAELAMELCDKFDRSTILKADSKKEFASSQRYIRGLFSGGTLAYETLLVLRAFTKGIYSNIPIDASYKLDNSASSDEHTIIDMGEDEFTVGRLHPMIDSDLRLRRFQQEAADPETAVILLDVVLGYGSHPNPAAELAPIISEAKSLARRSGRYLEVVVLVVGTESDPQDVVAQTKILRQSGAHIETNADKAAIYVGNIIFRLNPSSKASLRPVILDKTRQSLAAINVGLESFYESLVRQGAEAIHVDWQPPAQGKENLMNLLAKMKG
jgi:FdrA protein